MRVSGLLTGIVVAGLTVSAFAQGDGRQGRQGGAPGRGPQGPPITTLAGDVQNDLDRTRELFTNLVNAMPPEKFDFKPTPAQQTFGERVMHIVQADQFILRTLGGKAYKQFVVARPWQDGVPGFLRAGILVAFHFYVWAAFWQLSGARRTPADDALMRRLGTVVETVRLPGRLAKRLVRLVRHD